MYVVATISILRHERAHWSVYVLATFSILRQERAHRSVYVLATFSIPRQERAQWSVYVPATFVQLVMPILSVLLFHCNNFMEYAIKAPVQYGKIQMRYRMAY